MSNPYAAPEPRDDDAGGPPHHGYGGYGPAPAHGTPPIHGTPPTYGTPPIYGTPPAYEQPAVHGYPTQSTDSSAILALILGILGVVATGLITGIPAIVLGNRARRRTQAGQGTGDGIALAGVILGWIATAFSVLALLMVLGFLLLVVSSP